MKKLDDIPKKNVFEVPDGYFDRLPGIIQARVAATKKEPLWAPYVRYSLKYALPAMVIGAAGLFFLKDGENLTAEELLATVDTVNLVAYLEESDLSSDDLLEVVPLDTDEADALEDRSMNEIKVNEADAEYLSNEFESDFF
jgi:hypothetical protein